MADSSTDRYAASEQGLGYIYQPRFALLKLLQLPESTSVLIEKDDDLDFVNESGIKTLASLKHKGIGDRLGDLGVDFWKSVRIWLNRYNRDGRTDADLRFFLYTTARISSKSFLLNFVSGVSLDEDRESLAKLATTALAQTTSTLITQIAVDFNQLSDDEKEDFLSRISIFDGSPRIGDIPSLIKDQHMRSVRREFRDAVFERLEGWWNDICIKLLTHGRDEPVHGYEVSDKLSDLSDEYKADNLPITFRGKIPEGEIDTESDPRLFVKQLREIGIGSNRIRNAILDYYRAFEQRSAWARQNLLDADEMEEYEARLVDEWSRYRDVVFEHLDKESGDTVLLDAGKELYKWADLESGNLSTLRIRARVTEPYVVRGGFHILANSHPVPRIYWHPQFLERMSKLLGGG